MLRLGLVRAITPFKVIQGHRVWYQSKAHMRLIVINCNFPPILHRFRDIALERSKIAVFGLTSPRWKGSPGTIFVKFLSKGHRWPIVPNGVKHCRKFQSPE